MPYDFLIMYICLMIKYGHVNWPAGYFIHFLNLYCSLCNGC